MGAWAADILTDHGGKVTAVSDVNAAIVNENGLDIKGLRQHLAAGEWLECGGWGACWVWGEGVRRMCCLEAR